MFIPGPGRPCMFTCIKAGMFHLPQCLYCLSKKVLVWEWCRDEKNKHFTSLTPAHSKTIYNPTARDQGNVFSIPLRKKRKTDRRDKKPSFHPNTASQGFPWAQGRMWASQEDMQCVSLSPEPWLPLVPSHPQSCRPFQSCLQCPSLLPNECFPLRKDFLAQNTLPRPLFSHTYHFLKRTLSPFLRNI